MRVLGLFLRCSGNKAGMLFCVKCSVGAAKRKFGGGNHQLNSRNSAVMTSGCLISLTLRSGAWLFSPKCQTNLPRWDRGVSQTEPADKRAEKEEGEEGGTITKATKKARAREKGGGKGRSSREKENMNKTRGCSSLFSSPSSCIGAWQLCEGQGQNIVHSGFVRYMQ